MHAVGTTWNGLSVAHEVTMEDHYEFSWGEDIEWMNPLGVQSMGEASSMLPPFMTGTGLEPIVSNPYLGTRDASYTCGSAKRQTCDMGDVNWDGLGETLSMEDTFLPEEGQLYCPWELGEHDMQSLFVELHGNDYLEALDIAMCNLEAEGEQPFMNEWQVQEIVRSEENEFECWTSEQFVNVRAEENWSEAQLAEPSYVLIADDW